MINIDLVGASVTALMIALGVCGFIFGIICYTNQEKLCKRIEMLEDKIKLM